MLKDLKKSGFTIVELIVVIIVISVLASIVYISYDGYEKRAESSQINATVTSYLQAISGGTALEDGLTPTAYSWQQGLGIDTFAVCITSNSKRCCFYEPLNVSGSGVSMNSTVCGNNQELQDRNMLKSGAYDKVSSHLDSKKPELPGYTRYGSLQSCETVGFSTTRIAPASSISTLPCYSTEIAYVFGAIDLSFTNDGIIQYYLPPDHTDCHHDGVLTQSSSSFINFTKTGAPYTYRQTTGSAQFTLCMIAVS